MSKFCCGCVVVGVEARAWHFPSLGQPTPDSLPLGTGLTYPVVPPHPVHPFLGWALVPAPLRRGKASLSVPCAAGLCWGNQLPEELGTPVAIGTGTPASPKGHRLHLSPPPLSRLCLYPSFNSACHLAAPRLNTTSPFALRPVLSSILWESKESHLWDAQPLINWAAGITMIATANDPNSHSNTSRLSIAGATHHLTMSHVCPQTFPDAYSSRGLRDPHRVLLASD